MYLDEAKGSQPHEIPIVVRLIHPMTCVGSEDGNIRLQKTF